MMEKIKKTLIFLGIIMIFIIIVIIIIKHKNVSVKNETENYADEESIIDDTFKHIEMSSEFFSLLECVNNYYKNIGIIKADDSDIIQDYGEEYAQEIKEDANNTIAQILDEEYKKEYSTDVAEKYSFTDEDEKVILNDVVYYNINSDETIYLANGYLLNYNTYNEEEIKLIIIMNYNNYSYNILEKDYIENTAWNNIKVGDKVDKNELNFKTVLKEFNKFEDVEVSDEEIAKEYFYIYKINALHNSKRAYELVDSNYKESCFKDINQYVKYIEKNRIDVSNAEVSKYKVNIEDGYKQYICLDSNGKYYIFKEDTIMNFTVMLDTYTVDIPEFVLEYNKNEDTVKIGYNINNIVDAINNYNYRFIYNKLNSSFKSSKYSNETELEEDVEDIFFENNKLEINNIEKESEYYKCETTITNIDNTSETKKVTFFIKLNEGTDFEISFSTE